MLISTIQITKGIIRAKVNNSKNEEDVIYLPCSFNKLLNYFNDKGKMRAHENNIINTVVNNFDKTCRIT